MAMVTHRAQSQQIPLSVATIVNIVISVVMHV